MNLTSGVFTALVTPFQSNRIDRSAWKKLLERQAAAPIDGFVIAGTTGEAPTLKPAELQELVEDAKSLKLGIPLVIGVGGNNTEKVIENCRLAATLGGDAVLAVTPYYNKPPQWAMLRHFEEVAKHSPLPVILYNVPGRTAVDLLPESVEKLSRIKSIIAVKEASGLIPRFKELKSGVKRADFGIFSGDDPCFLPALENGATGIISVLSNVWPEEWVALFRAYKSGDLPRARALFQEFEKLQSVLWSVTNPIGIKWFGAQRGYWKDECRLPLLPLSEAPSDVRARFTDFAK